MCVEPHPVGGMGRGMLPPGNLEVGLMDSGTSKE